MTSDDDPQLDSNVLIQLKKGDAAFVAYACANKAAGMSYNRVVRDEFLARGLGTTADLEALRADYGITYRSFRGHSVSSAIMRLQQAFVGDRLGRMLQLADARVLVTAFLTAECLATGDLQLYKRARDLGMLVDFLGGGRAAVRAITYVPRPVVV